jgi:hypothetical protein
MEKPDIAIALEGEPKKPMKLPALPSEEADEMETPDLQVDEGEISAFDAVKAALKSGDSAEGAKALKGFIELCGASKGLEY